MAAVITFIGSGRVAEHLAIALHAAGHTIASIVSRNMVTGKSLAARVNSTACSSLEINSATELVIMAVPDDSLHDLSERITVNPGTVVVHTSGSTPIDIFPSSLPRHGVLYPLQTFTGGRDIDLSAIHFFTEASDALALGMIDRVAASMSANIHHLSSDKRRVLHLAAVYVSNFVNHMLASGQKLAETEGIDFRVFAPLIRETVNKAIDIGPGAAQTGPAVRNDRSTIEKHLNMLSCSEDLRNLYIAITESIIKQNYQ